MDLWTDVLLVTDEQDVCKAIINTFQKATGKSPRPKSIGGFTYHDLGTINSTRVFVVESEAGSQYVESTVQNGIAALAPTAVIFVSLAFGARPRSQSIGEVLVSQQLVIYDLPPDGQRERRQIGPTGNIPPVIPRNERPHASTWLINQFKCADLYGDKATYLLSFGPILSVEAIVANETIRDRLFRLSPGAIGGAIGGVGLYSACQDRRVDWILVEAIASWGDANTVAADCRLKAADNAASCILSSSRKQR